MLSSLTSYLFGGAPDADEKEPLFAVPGVVSVDDTIMFPDASLVVRPTDQPHEFVVSLERNDVPVDQRAVPRQPNEPLVRVRAPLNASVQLRRTLDLGIVFHIQGRDFLFEFDDTVSDDDILNVEAALCECVWKCEQRTSAPASEADNIFHYIEIAEDEGAAVEDEEAAAAAAAAAELPESPNQQFVGEVVALADVELFLFDPAANEFRIVRSDVKAAIARTGDDFGAYVHVFDETPDGARRIVWSEPITAKMNYRFDSVEHSLVWVHLAGDDERAALTWSIVFRGTHDDGVDDDDDDDESTDEAEQNFRAVWSRTVWETKSRMAFSEVPAEDVDWILGVDDDGDVRMGSDDGISAEDLAEYSAGGGSDDGGGARFGGDGDREHNSLLAVGARHNRHFVVRGSKLGIFKQEDEGRRLVFDRTIEDLKSPSDRKTFSPAKMMLHNQDDSLLMLHPTRHDCVMRLDVERGNVIDEWSLKGDGQSDVSFNAASLVPLTKTANVDGESTLLGLSEGSFFRIDPRLPRGKVVDTQAYQYARSTRPQLSCAATTAGGHMVVGSEKGDLRLFSAKQMQKSTPSGERKAPRATTRLPGVGDPIVAVDVSADGKWIVATCESYLLVVPTANADESKNIFENRLGAEKPPPRRLQLRPEHVRMMRGARVHFTAARFDEGSSTGERSIVTSSGRFLITWNFRLVTRGVLDRYEMLEYSQDVVADQFTYGGDDNVVVTMPDDVQMASKVVRTFQ